MKRKIKGVVFDLDGTLVDSPLDFAAIKREIGIPPDSLILESILEMTGRDRERAWGILLRHERHASRNARLRKGAREVMRALRERGLKVALLTRNSEESVKAILKKFGLEFDAAGTRDNVPPKPDPGGVRWIARKLGINPSEMLMVGDFRFDVLAGRSAGAGTVFLRNQYLPPPEADHVIENLADLLPLV